MATNNSQVLSLLLLLLSTSLIETIIQFQLQILGEKLSWPRLCQQPLNGGKWGWEGEKKQWVSFMDGDRRKSRVTKCHGLAGTFLVSALEVSCPGKPLSSEPTTTIGHQRTEAWGRKGRAFTFGRGGCKKEREGDKTRKWGYLGMFGAFLAVTMMRMLVSV